MLKVRPALMGVAMALIACTATDVDAKRLGAKSSAPPPAAAPSAKVESKGGQEAGGSGALRYGGAAVVGAAAGHATAKALKRPDQEEVGKGSVAADPEAAAAPRRTDKLTESERKAQVETMANKAEQLRQDSEARTEADLTRRRAEEKRRQDDINARRVAAEQEREEQKRQAQARELSCVIKPVMSDAEIKHCKWAWNASLR